MPPLDSGNFAGYTARVELEDVPWFPEDPYQCGPQSLASLLSASGVETLPAALVDDIYVPERKGSFAPELRAAARARGRLPYRVDGTLDALLTALADGYPVLIMQNLGLGFAPTWHFAVVIGYDRNDNKFLLRSGPYERLAMDTVHFERRWRLADYWGLVLLGPEVLPEWVALAEYESQLAHLERSWAPYLPDSYARMAARWPASTTANLGLGNLAYGRGELDAAAAYYRSVLAVDEDHIAALNNLAQVVAEQGRPAEGLALAYRALELVQATPEPEHPLRAAVENTVAGLQQKIPEEESR